MTPGGYLRDVPDALGSTANDLAKHGWVDGLAWGYELIGGGAVGRR